MLFNTMKKIYLVFSFLPLFTQAQNLPSCDSLVINCCTFDSVGPGTLSLFADNHSVTEFYGYPNFVLFDANMDTVAKETVTYFGIGSGFQVHTLDILTPVLLPFSGKLNLYKGFGATLCCSFPFSIPDTVNAVTDLNAGSDFDVYPNPSAGEVHVTFKNISTPGELRLAVTDVAGRELLVYLNIREQFQFNTALLAPGIYFLKLEDRNTKNAAVKKLVVN